MCPGRYIAASKVDGMSQPEFGFEIGPTHGTADGGYVTAGPSPSRLSRWGLTCGGI